MGLFSSKTGLPDGMGMNIAGGSLAVQHTATSLGISVSEIVLERRSAAGELGGAASVAVRDTRADNMGLFCSKTGLPDGMGMNIAGGSLAVQEEAATSGISVQEVIDRHRSRGRAAASLTNRGQRNSSMGPPCRNQAARVLGAQVGAAVMGQERWAEYIKTSCKKMQKLHKPISMGDSLRAEQQRPSGERDGWEFVPMDKTDTRWSMTDIITYRLPGHTEAKPNVYKETLREAISDAYHNEWTRYSISVRLDKLDEAAGKKLKRGR